jgi:excisionase family DNA binding protein
METAFYWTESGAANFLHITEREIRRLVEERRIPFVELPGGQVRFDPGDVADWCKTFRRPVLDLVPSDRMATDIVHT